jgi:hypothetical protein
MIPFNVIWENYNTKKFEAYDIMPHLVNVYKSKKDKPTTFDEFKQFIEQESRYFWWARCQYEIIISNWVGTKYEEKWDIHKQVMLNLDIITKILMDNLHK